MMTITDATTIGELKELLNRRAYRIHGTYHATHLSMETIVGFQILNNGKGVAIRPEFDRDDVRVVVALDDQFATGEKDIVDLDLVTLDFVEATNIFAKEVK